MRSTFWIVALINFINALSFTILIPTIYIYGRQFQLNDFETSLLFSIYSIAQFFATPIIGKLSDRFGRKPMLIISLAGTVVANVIAGTATTAGVLFFARFLDGITGGNISVAQAIITDITAPEERAKGFGVFGAALGLGFVVGPILSFVAQQRSIGTSFLASGAIAMIALSLTVLRLPETLTANHRQPQGSIFDLGLDKLISGLKIPGVGILVLLNFLTGTTFTMFTYAFQPYYLKVLGQDSQSLTILFFAFGLLGVLMQTQGIKLLTKSLKVSIVRILFLGLFFRSACFALMPVFPSLIYFVVVGMVFAIFNSLVQPMISTLISINSKPTEQGMTAGINASYLSISNGIGPVIAGLMINKQAIALAEAAERGGAKVNPLNYGSYSYPLYAAGILTFLVFWLAVRSQGQYAPQRVLENS
jgi:MFS family permease